MRTFVMGDIHGAYKALRQCLQRSGFDRERDTLIQLGDVVDGFDEVSECVEELIKIPKLIAIKGNHDNWLNEFILTGYHPTKWAQGGQATARSYSIGTGKENIPESHRQFFLHQRLYHIDRLDNCYVHAGFNRTREFQGQQPEVYYWDRDLWSAALLFNNFEKHLTKEFPMVTPFNKIFIGHTPTTNWDTDQPMRAANIYDLDTGCGHSGRLTIMDIDSAQYWQSDPVKQLYPSRKKSKKPSKDK